MKIIIAPNSFKNSAGAAEAAEAIKGGLKESRLAHTSELFPVGDGGDGTATLLTKKLGATTIHLKTRDPLGRTIHTSYGFVTESRTAIIGMADASGLRLLERKDYNPFRASSFGTGEMILDAMNKGCSRILLGIGGSATVDGGTGILEALGVRFYDRSGQGLHELPVHLRDIASVDTTGIDPRVSSTEIVVLCDVNNPLLGSNGAAAVFAPQKGALPGDIPVLEAALANWARVTLRDTGKDMAALKHGGAAGGVAAALSAYGNAHLVTGIDYFLSITGFDKILEESDLVITGEGSIDLQTLEGKAPLGVARAAKQAGLPVIGVAGYVPLNVPHELRKYFDALFPINHDTLSEDYLQKTVQNLQRTATQIGNLLAINQEG